jgi:hypothetical protein
MASIGYLKLCTKTIPPYLLIHCLTYAVGEAVANAAGSGLFGSGATKVSPEEAAALAKIKAALGI